VDAERNEQAPEQGRAEWDEVAAAPHAVVGDVPDIEGARLLIEALEKQGIPANAIELLEAETKDPKKDTAKTDVADAKALGSLAKSVIVGGVLGLIIGGLLGALVSLLIINLEWYWGALMVALFGAAVGGAAGGMSVAKYSSPAWDETYQVEDDPRIKVAVHHSEPEVVDDAEAVMEQHVEHVTRVGRSET
jgi:hypothetical protein